MFHTPTKDILYCAYRIQVEHLGPDGSAKTICGTAFFANTLERTYLITNRHNIDASSKDKKYVGYKIKKLTLSGYFYDTYLSCDLTFEHSLNETDHLQEVIIGYPKNPEEDVAVIDITNGSFSIDENSEMAQSGLVLNSQYELRPYNIPHHLIAEKDFISEIDICDMIAFPGYPAYFDRNGNRPIMRMGTIASDPVSDYRANNMECGRRIAYEAFSTGGSSGSPVFVLTKGWKAGLGISGGYFREMKLIGINSGHIKGTEDYSSHSGISYCFKTDCIWEAISDINENTSS